MLFKEKMSNNGNWCPSFQTYSFGVSSLNKWPAISISNWVTLNIYLSLNSKINSSLRRIVPTSLTSLTLTPHLTPRDLPQPPKWSYLRSCSPPIHSLKDCPYGLPRGDCVTPSCCNSIIVTTSLAGGVRTPLARHIGPFTNGFFSSSHPNTLPASSLFLPHIYPSLWSE